MLTIFRILRKLITWFIQGGRHLAHLNFHRFVEQTDLQDKSSYAVSQGWTTMRKHRDSCWRWRIVELHRGSESSSSARAAQSPLCISSQELAHHMSGDNVCATTALCVSRACGKEPAQAQSRGLPDQVLGTQEGQSRAFSQTLWWPISLPQLGRGWHALRRRLYVVFPLKPVNSAPSDTVNTTHHRLTEHIRSAIGTYHCLCSVILSPELAITGVSVMKSQDKSVKWRLLHTFIFQISQQHSFWQRASDCSIWWLYRLIKAEV